MTNLRKLAKGKPCMVRMAGVCNGDPQTTVLAHVRLSGISGMGIKSPDFLAAWCCSACHQWADTHNDALTRSDFYEGVFRTQNQLIKEKLWTGN